MNVHLRALQEKDATGMLEWMTDPTIICFFRFDASDVSLDRCLTFIHNAEKDKNSLHYAIVNDEDEYLGTISLKNIDNDKRNAEYAVSTQSCAHGTGAAMQATREILSIAFLDLNLNQVYLNVLAENKRANAFYRKVGFRYERCEEKAIEIRKELKDLNWYSISREEFLKEQ